MAAFVGWDLHPRDDASVFLQGIRTFFPTDQSVLAATDRPIIVITELVQGSTMRYETRMHIALTRATVSAVIVCDEAAVQGDPRLQLLR